MSFLDSTNCKYTFYSKSPKTLLECVSSSLSLFLFRSSCWPVRPVKQQWWFLGESVSPVLFHKSAVCFCSENSGVWFLALFSHHL